jgi:uncharacterized membrane protein
MRKFRIFSMTALTVATLLAASTAVYAGFRVCNRSSESEIDVAYGHQTRNDEWLSEGWWTVRRGHCETLVGGSLRHRYYYVYGKSEGRVWEAGKGQDGGDFCTKNEKFTLPGDMNCARAGYDTHKFDQIDTEDYDDYTYNLRD